MRKRIFRKDTIVKVVGVTETEMEGIRSGYGGDQEKEVEKVEEEEVSIPSAKAGKKSARVFESDDDEDSSSDEEGEEEAAPPSTKQVMLAKRADVPFESGSGFSDSVASSPAKKRPPLSTSKPTKKFSPSAKHAAPRLPPARAAGAHIEENTRLFASHQAFTQSGIMTGKNLEDLMRFRR